MASAIRKAFTRLLIYLVRRDSSISKPYFLFCSLIYSEYSIYNLAIFGALADNDENIIFEHFTSRSVSVYPPRHGKQPSDRSHSEIECPPVRAYLFRENRIHVNSSCAFDPEKKIYRDVYEDHVWEWPSEMFSKCANIKIHGFLIIA